MSNPLNDCDHDCAVVRTLRTEVERLKEAELLRATEMVKLEQRIGQQEVEIERLKAALRAADALEFYDNRAGAQKARRALGGK
jgi:uncharacterized small protein (DUF1192 family)